MKKKLCLLPLLLLMLFGLTRAAAQPDDRDPYRYKVQLLAAFSRLTVDMQDISGLPLDENSAAAYQHAVTRALPSLTRLRNLRAPKSMSRYQAEITKGADYTAGMFKATLELLEAMRKGSAMSAKEKADLERKARALSGKFSTYEREMLRMMGATVDALSTKTELPASDPYRSAVMTTLTEIYAETKPVVAKLRQGRAPSTTELDRYLKRVAPLYKTIAGIKNPPVYLRGAQTKLRRGAESYMEHREISYQYIGILLQADFNITSANEAKLAALNKRLRKLSAEARYFNEAISEIFSY
jgi:uncharacterized protein YhaN